MRPIQRRRVESNRMLVHHRCHASPLLCIGMITYVIGSKHRTRSVWSNLKTPPSTRSLYQRPRFVPLSHVRLVTLIREQRHPSLSIPAPLSYSPSARSSTPLSPSLSSSDTGTPTSTMDLLDTVTSTSTVPQIQSTMVLSPKAGQGVFKLPSTK